MSGASGWWMAMPDCRNVLASVLESGDPLDNGSAGSPTEDERHDEQHQEQEEENLGEQHHRAFEATEAEDTGDQGQNQKGE